MTFSLYWLCKTINYFYSISVTDILTRLHKKLLWNQMYLVCLCHYSVAGSVACPALMNLYSTAADCYDKDFIASVPSVTKTWRSCLHHPEIISIFDSLDYYFHTSQSLCNRLAILITKRLYDYNRFIMFKSTVYNMVVFSKLQIAKSTTCTIVC